VLHRVTRLIAVFALCCTVGLQWLVLQSFAWTTMLIENSKHAPLGQAISKTFDGAHPCSVCHFVNHHKNSEKKSDLQIAKIDLICVAQAFQLMPRFVNCDYFEPDFSISEIGHSPPVPPPRLIHA
jgi:hypothetical protein